LYFENLYFFLVFLVEDTCHTTRTIGHTLKEKENNFLVFLKTIWKKVSHYACGRTDTI